MSQKGHELTWLLMSLGLQVLANTRVQQSITRHLVYKEAWTYIHIPWSPLALKEILEPSTWCIQHHKNCSNLSKKKKKKKEQDMPFESEGLNV